jgi:hypothetical protein
MLLLSVLALRCERIELSVPLQHSMTCHRFPGVLRACRFWGSVGFQLQLKPQQIATLTAVNDMMQAAVAPLYQSIGQGARQALEMTLQQEQQPQQRLLHAHSKVVQQQGSALSKIKMMALQVGAVHAADKKWWKLCSACASE